MDFNRAFDLTGKTALVTGASSGLGRAFAMRLAEQGANVVVAARREDRLKAVVEDIAKLPAEGGVKPGKAKLVVLDVGVPDAEIQAGVGRAWEAFGGIDILVNNAGVLEPMTGSSLDVAPQDWSRTLNINVLGSALVLKHVARLMAEAGRGGSIINLSSIVGAERGLLSGMAMYAASKAAVTQLTKALAIELGPKGIRVNSLSPSAFESEMSGGFLGIWKEASKKLVPLGRPGDVDPDLTGPLLFLASDASAFMTGNNLFVDGGYTLSTPPIA